MKNGIWIWLKPLVITDKPTNGFLLGKHLMRATFVVAWTSCCTSLQGSLHGVTKNFLTRLWNKILSINIWAHWGSYKIYPNMGQYTWTSINNIILHDFARWFTWKYTNMWWGAEQWPDIAQQICHMLDGLY